MNHCFTLNCWIAIVELMWSQKPLARPEEDVLGCEPVVSIWKCQHLRQPTYYTTVVLVLVFTHSYTSNVRHRLTFIGVDQSMARNLPWKTMMHKISLNLNSSGDSWYINCKTLMPSNFNVSGIYIIVSGVSWPAGLKTTEGWEDGVIWLKNYQKHTCPFVRSNLQDYIE